MYFAALLIGLREGLEASLIIGILIAYMHKMNRNDALRPIWIGIGSALLVTVALGALFTFGRYTLTFKAQEVLGGTLSLVAVAMVTWMVFWMMKAGGNIKRELEEGSNRALLIGSGWGVFWLAFMTVGREGLETTLMLWGWMTTPLALLGALTGLVVSAALGYLAFRQAIRINYGKFFAWTGVFLIVVAAGIVAYGIHDLQEAAVLPGPFSGAPITPTDVRTGEVLTGFTDNPFWAAAYPFGWAFNFEDVIAPTGFLASLLKGTIGFTPMMTWLEVTAWAIYLLVIFPRFIRRVREQSRANRERAAAKAAAAKLADIPEVSAADSNTHGVPHEEAVTELSPRPPAAQAALSR